ncbi:MAG: hypothetical protein JO143_11195, partial [Acetobacteraceae bacterium]|nr:hypothetical protein [Acetobacteraceae bacterium]
PFINPPGYNSLAANVAAMKAGKRPKSIIADRHGRPIDAMEASVQDLMANDTVFAGTPDDVVAQLRAFNDRMGGVGHLLFFGQGGLLDHRDTVENIKLFAREVAPRIAELGAPEAIAAE